MSRVLLAQWRVPALGTEGVVERSDGRENVVDRWFAGLAGRVAPWRSGWETARLMRQVQAMLALDPALRALDEDALTQRIAAARDGLRRQGFSRDAVGLAFALVREVARRELGKSHYPVQLLGGLVMLSGRLAEMQTGEGKTLTALLPVCTAALAGAPAHVITVNDYLAARDAEVMGPVYRRFGLDVGVVQEQQPPGERSAAWRCAVVYTTNKDLVFDYLRDRLGGGRGTGGPAALHSAVVPLLDGGRSTGGGARRLRGLYFALVDEADSVLVDEARTPLILSAERHDAEDQAAWERSLQAAAALQPGEDYRVLAKERAVELTSAGEDHIDELLQGAPGLLAARRGRQSLLRQALTALNLYRLDQHYIVREGKIVIVDENTGRVMPDRSWERGLHQMIELKEGLETSARRDTLARITYQRFFRRYLRLAGMTGTAMEVAGELRAVYALDVVRVPTHRPVQRRNLGLRIFRDPQARWEAVAARAAEVAAAGRAVLIGTRSVAASDAVSAALQRLGLEHALLNARQDGEEADVIALAGAPRRIPVAPNMAGRGTDILLDPGVHAAGGLHVILTEFHESARIDRQLFGRAGRQGDPGSYEALAALDDEIFRAFGGGLWRMLRALMPTGPGCLPAPAARALRRLAQSRAESHFSAVRRRTVEDDRKLDRRLAFGGRER